MSMKREKALKIIDAVKRIREELTDEKALDYIVLYHDWSAGEELKIGERVKYNEKLYKVITTHITQSDWTPEVAFTLFEPIDIINEGTLTNPIIAAAGMTYFKGKYYLDETDNKIYLCIRDDNNGNGIVLHFMPNDLVGLYFNLINE